MEPNFYTETATVLNADADFRSLLKPSALLRYVEQVSADHARAFGMDDKFFLSNACPTVCPRFNALRIPCSKGSCSTISSFTCTD